MPALYNIIRIIHIVEGGIIIAKLSSISTFVTQTSIKEN